jgi:hypothetical protein
MRKMPPGMKIMVSSLYGPSAFLSVVACDIAPMARIAAAGTIV